MASATAEELLEFLIDSARYGDTEDVKLAIQEKVAVDGQDSAGRTGAVLGASPENKLLICAASHWLCYVARAACIEGPAPATVKHCPCCPAATAAATALHMASANGHADIVQLLLEATAVSKPPKHQRTPAFAVGLHFSLLGSGSTTLHQQLTQHTGSSAAILQASTSSPCVNVEGLPGLHINSLVATYLLACVLSGLTSTAASPSTVQVYLKHCVLLSADT